MPKEAKTSCPCYFFITRSLLCSAMREKGRLRRCGDEIDCPLDKRSVLTSEDGLLVRVAGSVWTFMIPALWADSCLVS